VGGRGKEGEVEVPHLLATRLGSNNCGLTIQISHFHRYHCIIQISPKLEQAPPVLALLIHLPLPNSDHLESIPIFNRILRLV
jgi:hypothetical protein